MKKNNSDFGDLLNRENLSEDIWIEGANPKEETKQKIYAMLHRIDKMTFEEAIQPINYCNLRDILVLLLELTDQYDKEKGL